MKFNKTGETQDLSPEAISHSIRNTYERLKQHLVPTRVVFDPSHHLYLKCEHEQTSGSFKLRGALSKLSLIEPHQKIVTASTGNHGLGVVTAAKIFQLQPIIFLPATASARKVEKLKLSGAQLNLVEGDSLAAELAAKAFAHVHELPWISPYNDPEVCSCSHFK